MNKKIIIAGLVSSIVMAMMEMAYEGLFGVGFWSAPVFISATILRDFQTVALPVVFTLVPVVLGMIGHMMNSVILSFAFVFITKHSLRSRLYGAFVGVIYATIIFFAMWFMILPIIDPVMLNLNPMVFALSHIIWGAVLGGMIGRRQSSAVDRRKT